MILLLSCPQNMDTGKAQYSAIFTASLIFFFKELFV